MPRGLFTQCAVVLLNEPVDDSVLRRALEPFTIVKRVENSSSWLSGPVTYVLPHRPEVNGYVAVDSMDRVWPDGMGDPKSDAELFAAWVMGQFGPGTFPGALARAAQHAWVWDRTQAERIGREHTGFLRIRTSYSFGAHPDTPVLPADWNPIPEIQQVTAIARSLLDLSGSIAYFNPSGEVLRDRTKLHASLTHNLEHNLPDIDVWTNVRMFRPNQDWLLMDTVGSDQIDLPDVEACFFTAAYDPPAVDNFLRNVTLYLHSKGQIIRDGDTMDGPGGIRWQAKLIEESELPPPRRVLSWIPCDDRHLPDDLAVRRTSKSDNSKPWWKFWA